MPRWGSIKPFYYLTRDYKSFSGRRPEGKERKEQILAETETLRLHAEIGFAKVNDVAKNYLLKRAMNVASMWPILNDDERRRLVQDLVDKIEIGDDSMHFVLSYFPSLRVVGKDTHNPTGS
jgi:site-specific DNA recombinase